MPGQWLLGFLENLLGGSHLHQIAGAAALGDIHSEEGGRVGHPHGLLHVVGDQRDGVFLLEFDHQFLDPPGRDRVQRRAGLVHQQHVRFGGDGASDAQPLLLAAGQGQTAVFQLVFHLIPASRALEGLLHPFVQVALETVQAQAEGNVVVDAHRKRVRLLEHHADIAAHHHGIDFPVVDVLTVVGHLALETKDRDQVVHAVEAAQHGAFAAARRTDKAGDLVLLDRYRAGTHGEKVAVKDLIDLTIHHDVVAGGCVCWRRTSRRHFRCCVHVRWPRKSLSASGAR